MPVVNQLSSIPGVNIFVPKAEREHVLGTRANVVYGANKDKSAEVIYIKAGAALTANLVYELPLLAGTDAFVVDTALTKTSAATFASAQNMSFAACVPCATFANGEFGWAFVQGQIPIDVAASCVAYARLGLTATAGRIDDADVDYQIQNCHVLTTVGGVAAISDCYANADLRVYRNLV